MVGSILKATGETKREFHGRDRDLPSTVLSLFSAPIDENYIRMTTDLPNFRRSLATLFVAILAVLVGATDGHAQGKNSFFPKGYADAPGAAAPRPTPPRAKPTTKPQPVQNSQSETERSDGQLFQQFEGGESNGVDSDTSIMEQSEGIDIFSVSLIVNSLDERHLLAVLLSLRELSMTRRVRVASVQTVGMPLSPYLSQSLGDAGVACSSRQKLADDTFQQSPVWIIETAKGLVYLEGIISPLRFITPRGKFVSRE